VLWVMCDPHPAALALLDGSRGFIGRMNPVRRGAGAARQCVRWQRAQEILPPFSGPVAYGQAPLFDTLAMPLPDFAADFGFTFGAPTWSLATGVYPVLDDGQVGRERFETPKPAPKATAKRKVTVNVGGEKRSELMEVAG